MKRILIVSVALMVGLASACRDVPKQPQQAGPLSRAIYFVERDQDGQAYGLSQSNPTAPASSAPKVTTGSEAPPSIAGGGAGSNPPKTVGQDGPTDSAGVDSRRVERIPRGMQVDYQSTIDIEFLRHELAASAKRPELTSDAEALRQRADELRKLLTFVAPLLESRARAMEQFDLGVSGTDTDPLEEQRDRFAALELEMLKGIRELWPDVPGQAQTLAERKRIVGLLNGLMNDVGGDERFSRYVQGEVDAIDRAVRATVADVRASATRLRLEAFLVPSGGDAQATAVHLEGYDRIQQRRVESTDRFGLALSEPEMARLSALFQSTRELAEALEKVRRGEQKLSDALKGLSSSLARDLAALVTEIESLQAELDPTELGKRAARTKAAIESFAKDAEKLLAENVRDTAGRARNDAQAKLDDLVKKSAGVRDLLDVLRRVKEARDAWSNVSFATIEDAITKGLALIPAIEAATAKSKDAVAQLKSALEDVAKMAQKWPGDLSQDVVESITKAYASSGLEREVESWRSLGARAESVATRVLKILPGDGDRSRFKPIDVSVRAPSAIDVPIDDAPDTFVALDGSGARPGDRLEVRATLVNGSDNPPTSSAIFEVAKLGWHAEFHPAVVLVTADSLAGRPDDTGFSASLAWMLEYTPRRDEDDFWSDFSRATQWGVGLHAALLNFDPNNDAEIGLGMTVGLWGEKLLFGAGYNIAADADNEGRYYYYIGSSLIPLLQALKPVND